MRFRERGENLKNPLLVVGYWLQHCIPGIGCLLLVRYFISEACDPKFEYRSREVT